MLLSGFAFPIANMPEPVQDDVVNPSLFLVIVRSISERGGAGRALVQMWRCF